jgi:UDP-N-acetylmuramate dehydrogenase
MQVSAGTPLLTVAIAARDAALSGVEFAYGIPGTAGGAVLMNAGAFGGCMAQVCTATECYHIGTGQVQRIAGDAQRFGYRTSLFSQHPELVILGTTLTLTPERRETIEGRMQAYLQRRKETQPLEFPSAGSTFKRPDGFYVGKLIEDCGLKGVCVGGAQVSEKHAGFIVNRGGATAGDVKALVEQIRTCVQSRFGVELECEIRFL